MNGLLSRDMVHVHVMTIQEACCDYMTIVVGKESQNTSKSLPNQCVSMRKAAFCKTMPGHPSWRRVSIRERKFFPTTP